MALKLMIFVDGHWFYDNRQALFNVTGEDSFEIDYKRITTLVQNSISEELNLDVDLVRTFYYDTLLLNKPEYNTAKRRSFYEFLAFKCGFETVTTEIDYQKEGDMAEDYSIRVSLTAAAIRYASIPGTCDVIAIAAGHSEYKELAKQLRELGKRVQLVTIHNPSDELSSNSTSLIAASHLFDFKTYFLDDHVEELRLIREEQNRVCKICNAEEITTWAGADFFCTACRAKHQSQPQNRICDICGCKEVTTWDKDYFYCTECRRQHRESK